MLFHGPPGTGKTTTILAVARELYGSAMNQLVLELNASDDRGIDVVREQVKEFVSTRHMFAQNRPKLVILDECDNMTSAAQFSLRRIMEQFSSNARFCLICNYTNDVIPALQSRCTKFRFGPVPASENRPRIQEICQLEGIRVTDGGIDTLIDVCEGDMRRILNTLQATAMSFPDGVDERAVQLTTGTPLREDMDNLLKCLFSESFEGCVARLESMRVHRGYALVDMIAALSKRLEVSSMISNNGEARCRLNSCLADIEKRLSAGCSDKIQGKFLVSVVKAAIEAGG